MSKQPRKPREIKRAADAKPERVASRIVFFLREHSPAETVRLQREQLMTIHRALFSSLLSQAVGWFIARLFRHRALISMGKARPSVKPLV